MAKADKIEILKRLRTVQEWMMQGQNTTDIIRQCVSQWGISERQAYRIIEKGYDDFYLINKRHTKRKLYYHVEARRKLFRDLKDKNTPKGARTANLILDSMAKLEGVFIEKHEVTGKDGQPLVEATTTVVILPSNGHESDTKK